MGVADPGVGIDGYSLSDPNDSSWTGIAANVGNQGTGCVTSVQCGEGPYYASATDAGLPTGANTIEACALDAFYTSCTSQNTATTTAYVDTTRPTIQLSGSLIDHSSAVNEGNSSLVGDTPEQLVVSVGDGNDTYPQSGPDQVTIAVDGQPVSQSLITYTNHPGISSPSSVCPPPPAPQTAMPNCYSGWATWTFYPEQYAAGEHTITVGADDWAYPTPNQAYGGSFNIWINHSAQASVGPGSLNLATGELGLELDRRVAVWVRQQPDSAARVPLPRWRRLRRAGSGLGSERPGGAGGRRFREPRVAAGRERGRDRHIGRQRHLHR